MAKGLKAPKTEKFHSEAWGEEYRLLEQVTTDHHSRLKRSKFLILMKHGGWNSKGKTVFGKAKVLADDLRRLLKKDAIIYLNADMWSAMTAPQRKYTLDHTLYTLDVKCDNEGNVKEAADGRPLLGTVPPDIEGFAAVIKRHGVIMEDVKRLALALKETNNQLTIEDAAAQQEDPREGVKGTIGPDGTVTVEEDDKNQLLLADDGGVVTVDGQDPEDPMSGVGEDDLPGLE